MYDAVLFDGAAAKGMPRTNNNYARGHEALATGCTSKDESISFLGTFHLLPIKLQELLVVEAKQKIKSLKKSFDKALAKQKAACLRKDEIAHQKK